jgi:hypothetical protein
MNLLVDVQSVDYHDNIYARYATLREQHPVYHDASRDIWMISRYDAERRDRS